VSGKAIRLRRLLAIRRLSEDVDRRALAQTLASVAEVEEAITRQGTVLVDVGRAAREALAAGDRAEWLLADAQREAAGWNRKRLGSLLASRAVAVPPAMEKFLHRRREHEQIKQLVRNMKQSEEIEDGRRQQLDSDDWFLSRRMRSLVGGK